MNAHPDLYFGTLAVKNGFASSSEIELALEAQKDGATVPLKLGEILEEMGTLTRTQVTAVLETQSRLRQPAPEPVRFEEILPASLVQESGPALSVNGEPLSGPRTLKSGDRLKAGDLEFRVAGESIEIVPRKETPVSPSDSTVANIPTAPAEPPKAPEAAAPKPGLADKLLPPLRRADGLIARIPPAIHTQRKYVLAGALFGGVALILPWRIAANGNSVLGIQGPGWLTVLLTFVAVGCTLVTRPGDPFTKIERLAASGASALALLIGIAKFLFPPSYATGRGIGLYLGVFSTLCVLAASAFARAGGTAAGTESPTLGMRLWKKLSGFAGSVSGRRAKELAAAMEQRDALLRKIGEAALEAHKDLPEAAAAIQARDALQNTPKDEAGVKAKATQKAADAKAKRAFGKLAQKALEGGLALPGQESAIADLKAVEAKIKELS